MTGSNPGWPEPSQREVTAEVKWYNPTKGFGFVQLSDGSTDAFLHVSVVEPTGRRDLPDGTKIVCDISDGRKGRQVAFIHRIESLGQGSSRDNDRGGYGDRDRGGYGDRDRGGYGDRDRGGYGDRDRGGYGDRDRGGYGGGDRGGYSGGGYSDRGGYGDRDRGGYSGGGDRGGYSGGGDRGGYSGGGDRGGYSGGGDRGGYSAAPAGPLTTLDGKVKFFDQAKGYGFVSPDDGTKDVFISARTLGRLGLTTLENNQKVRLQVRSGPKGPQAESVELI